MNIIWKRTRYDKYHEMKGKYWEARMEADDKKFRVDGRSGVYIYIYMAKHSPENRPPGHETDLFLPEPESVLESTDGWHAEVTTGCMRKNWLQHSYKYLKSKTKRTTRQGIGIRPL